MGPSSGDVREPRVQSSLEHFTKAESVPSPGTLAFESPMLKAPIGAQLVAFWNLQTFRAAERFREYACATGARRVRPIEKPLSLPIYSSKDLLRLHSA